MTSIKDLLQKGKSRSNEDTQLKRALELSKQEHIKEQKRILRQFAKPIQRKQRIIQKEEEEENDEDWFQTISSRPQHKNQAKRETRNRTKRETRSQTKRETANRAESQAKKEIVKQEEPFEFDLSSIFDEQQNEFFENNADNSLPMVSDAESDCSVIDLCNQDANQTNAKSVEQSMNESVGDTGELDDDGYLSPLEGFISLNDSEKSQQYLAQFITKPIRKRKTPTTTGTKRKKTNKRWYKKKTNK